MNKISRALLLVIVAASSAGAQATSPAQAEVKPGPSSAHKPDRAAAYYHYALAHMYEEQVTLYARSELTSKAIEEYRLAIESDPSSEFLTSGLAELYAKTGRIADAVREAQDIIKRDPNNLEARKLLGRIYLRSLGDMPGGHSSDNILKLAIEQYEQIVKIEPTSVDDHLLLGRLYHLNNDLGKAENEWKTAVKLDPNSEEAITQLSVLYGEEGDTTHALKVLTEVPESARSAKLYSALGSTYEQLKRYKDAIDAFRHAIELDRDNLDAIRGLAENLLNDGQTDAALEQFKVIADANPEDAQTYVRMAEIYRRQGKYDLALETLKKAESMAPDALQVPYNMAAVYQSQGRYDDAAKIFQDLIKKTEKSDNSYNKADRDNRALFIEHLGSVYRDQENYQAAVEAFRKMLSLGEENAERGYEEIIDTYRDAKQWAQATAAAKEAVQKLPNDHSLRMILDSQIADAGDPDKALADVRSLANGSPDDHEVYVTLATMNMRLKRWNDASSALDKAEPLSSKPEEKEYIAYLRGSIQEHQKNYDEAEAQFRKILAANPQSGATLNYLGYMNVDRGVRLEEALALIKAAVQLEPNNGAYLDSLGWAYFKLGKYDLAEENLTKALQHMGSDPTVQDHLGDLYQKTGRLKQAAAHWERALDEWNKSIAIDVEPTDVAKTQKKLDAARVKIARGETEKP
jgi:tetratricopeptide (TPR) repeat protein